MGRRMLYLTRKVGESIIINENIELTIVEVRGKTAKLGITFPPEATVLRKELHERIKQENLAAAGGDDGGGLDSGLDGGFSAGDEGGKKDPGEYGSRTALCWA